MNDWIDDLFDTVESYDDSSRLRDYCFNLWDEVDFVERFEAYDFWARIESGNRDELIEILRQLNDRRPDKVRAGTATQKEIVKFINDRI